MPGGGGGEAEDQSQKGWKAAVSPSSAPQAVPSREPAAYCSSSRTCVETLSCARCCAATVHEAHSLV